MPEATTKSSGQLETAFQELHNEYLAMGGRFGVSPHKYWSTGAFKFNVFQSYVDANGFTRYLAKCPAQSKIEFFSYALDDDAGGAGLPTEAQGFRASIAETNLANRRQTNDEDFAIEGIAITSRGCRVTYPSPNPDALSTNGSPSPALDSTLALLGGAAVITDPSSTILPPEVSAPLTLENVLYQALRCKVSLQMFWDLKASDYLGLWQDAPEGGGNSYLMAQGDPAVHNYMKLKDGYPWRKSNSNRDKLLSIIARCEQDVIVAFTLPPLNQGLNPSGGDLGDISSIAFELRLSLCGQAFYVPSTNI